MSEAIHPCDRYRIFEDIDESDTRGIGVFQTMDLRGWHRYVDESLVSTPLIPLEVRIQIENVKNLFLYSWFVYRFATVAMNQMLNITELALAKKFEMAQRGEPKGLHNKLKQALKEGWLKDAEFLHSVIEASEEDSRPHTIIQGIAGIRNSMNHGSTMLLDPLSLLMLCKNYLALINSLFLREGFEEKKHV